MEWDESLLPSLRRHYPDQVLWVYSQPLFSGTPIAKYRSKYNKYFLFPENEFSVFGARSGKEKVCIKIGIKRNLRLLRAAQKLFKSFAVFRF